jgi:hypothetical protein
MFDPIVSSMGYIKSGQFRALGVNQRRAAAGAA